MTVPAIAAHDGGVLDSDGFDTYRVAVEFSGLAARLRVTSASLRDHLDRASASIVLSVAEGLGRCSAADRAHFFAIARKCVRIGRRPRHPPCARCLGAGVASRGSSSLDADRSDGDCAHRSPSQVRAIVSLVPLEHVHERIHGHERARLASWSSTTSSSAASSSFPGKEASGRASSGPPSPWRRGGVGSASYL